MQLTKEILSMFRECEKDYKRAHYSCESMSDHEYQRMVSRDMQVYRQAYG